MSEEDFDRVPAEAGRLFQPAPVAGVTEAERLHAVRPDLACRLEDLAAKIADEVRQVEDEAKAAELLRRYGRGVYRAVPSIPSRVGVRMFELPPDGGGDSTE